MTDSPPVPRPPDPVPPPGGCPVPGPADLRVQMDLVLKQVEADPALRADLIADPVATLGRLGFDTWTSRYVADAWGVGPLADCGDTCRLTQACGWTVCGKTTNGCLSEEDDLRARMDGILARTRNDPELRQALIAEPEKTLAGLGVDAWSARHVADAWGIGPVGDCGSDTCRLTQACGWTVCGKTTNSCQDAEGDLRRQMDDLLARAGDDRGFRRALIDDPEKTLTESGLDPWSARHVADAWGLGPVADCGSDTCRLTQACGWTVCGKTTNSCLGE
jgi:hypothetical protein